MDLQADPSYDFEKALIREKLNNDLEAGLESRLTNEGHLPLKDFLSCLPYAATRFAKV